MIQEEAIDKWLQRQKNGRRKEWQSYLFMPYSTKISDIVYLYTQLNYDHWVTVEWDQKIVQFNESPPVVEIACNGKLNKVTFEMACLDRSNKIILRRLMKERRSAQASIEAAIDRWALEAGLKIERLQADSFSGDDLELEGKKDFISFITVAKADPDIYHTELVLDYVRRNPGVPIVRIQEYFSDIDPTTVIAIIGKLLMLSKVSANPKSHLLDRNQRINPR